MFLAPAVLTLLACSSAAFTFPASDGLPNPPALTQVNFGGSIGSVALDGSGTVAVVGAAGNGNGAAEIILGVATVFAQDGFGAWANCTIVGGAGAGVLPGASFGKSLALSADATTLLVGAPGRSPYDGNGTAWVYTSTGGVGCSATWALTQVLLPDDGALIGIAFGLTVALSADGTVALISAPGEASNAGAVYVFTRAVAGGSFSQTSKWLGARRSDMFGRNAMALSASGTVALIGAQGVAHRTGAATLMTATGAGSSTWTSTPLVPAEPSIVTNDAFGYAVALSADGTVALVGAPSADAGAGRVYAFTSDGGGNWSQTGSALLATDVPWATAQCTPSAFGYAIAMAGGAAFAVIGAPTTTCGDAGAVGAAYLFAAPAGDAAASWWGVANLMPPGASAGAMVGRAVAASSGAASAATALVCQVSSSTTQCFAALLAAIPSDVEPPAGMSTAQLVGIVAGAVALAAAAATGVFLWRRHPSRSVAADARKSAATINDRYASTRFRSSAAENALDDDEDGALSASEVAAIGAEAARAIGREAPAAAYDSTAVAATSGSGRVLRAARVAALINPVAVATHSELSPQ